MPEPASGGTVAGAPSPPNGPGPVRSVDALRVVSDRVLRVLVIVLGVAVLVFAATVLRVVVLGVLLAIVLSTALEPIVRRLDGRGVPRGLASFAGLLAGLLVLGGIVAVIVPPAVAEFGDLGDGVAGGVDVLQRWADDGFLGLSGQELSGFVDRAQQELQSNASQLSQGAITGAVRALEVLVCLALAVVLLFFFLKDGASLWRWLVELAPARHRADVDELGRRMRRTLSSYLRGATFVALVDAVFIGIALLAIGVPLVLPLALLTFLGGFIPIAGAFIAGLAAVLVALVAVGPWAAVAALVAILVVQQIEGNVLQPLVMGRTLSLHPVAVLLAVTTGSVLAGVIGALIATPLVAMAGAALRYWRFERAEGGGPLVVADEVDPRDGESSEGDASGRHELAAEHRSDETDG